MGGAESGVSDDGIETKGGRTIYFLLCFLLIKADNSNTMEFGEIRLPRGDHSCIATKCC